MHAQPTTLATNQGRFVRIYKGQRSQEVETTRRGGNGYQRATPGGALKDHQRRPGASCRRWELLFLAPMGPMFDMRLSIPNPESKPSETCQEFPPHPAQAGKLDPESCEALLRGASPSCRRREGAVRSGDAIAPPQRSPVYCSHRARAAGATLTARTLTAPTCPPPASQPLPLGLAAGDPQGGVARGSVLLVCVF